MCQCQAQRKREADARRPNARARGYDSEWEKVRAAYLRAKPWCSHHDCEAMATEVDHIKSVRDRPDLRLTWSNLRSFCKHHHSQRTARDQGFARRGRSQTFGGEPWTGAPSQRENFLKSVPRNAGGKE